MCIRDRAGRPMPPGVPRGAPPALRADGRPDGLGLLAHRGGDTRQGRRRARGPGRRRGRRRR
eukprot:6505665-Alexandrium_andersonii.AAC.1